MMIGGNDFSNLTCIGTGHTTETQQLWDAIAAENADALSDEESMEVIRREFNDTLFLVEHDLSDLDYDDVYRDDLSDPDDDLEFEASLEGCPFDVDDAIGA